MAETATTATAGAAVLSPLWLPNLHSLSALAAEILPILGAIWLIVQIITKVIETRRKARQASLE
jgi:hypothetical protein